MLDMWGDPLQDLRVLGPMWFLIKGSGGNLRVES